MSNHERALIRRPVDDALDVLHVDDVGLDVLRAQIAGNAFGDALGLALTRGIKHRGSHFFISFIMSFILSVILSCMAALSPSLSIMAMHMHMSLCSALSPSAFCSPTAGGWACSWSWAFGSCARAAPASASVVATA